MDVSALHESARGGVQDTSIEPIRQEVENTEADTGLDVNLARAQEADRDYNTTVMLNRLTGKGTLIDERV